jgi:hypothetical protein
VQANHRINLFWAFGSNGGQMLVGWRGVTLDSNRPLGNDQFVVSAPSGLPIRASGCGFAALTLPFLARTARGTVDERVSLEDASP